MVLAIVRVGIISYLILPTLPALSDIDLTPQRVEKVIDNDTISFVSFRLGGRSADGKKRVLFKEPKEWVCNGDSANFTMRSNGMNPMEVTFVKTPLQAPVTFNEEQQKQFADESVSLLPSGSSNAVVISKSTNPAGLGGHPTIEISLTYAFYGRTFRTNFLYLNLGDTLLRIKIACEKSKFEEQYRIFGQSIYSWVEE